MSLLCLQYFLQKNKQKQVDLRFHSSKVEFVRRFWRKRWIKKLFPLCLTFSISSVVEFPRAGLRKLIKSLNLKFTWSNWSSPFCIPPYYKLLILVYLQLGMAQGIMMTPFLKLTGSCSHSNIPGNLCFLASCHYATKKVIVLKN